MSPHPGESAPQAAAREALDRLEESVKAAPISEAVERLSSLINTAFPRANDPASRDWAEVLFAFKFVKRYAGEIRAALESTPPASPQAPVGGLENLKSDDGFGQAWSEFGDTSDWDDAVEAVAAAFGEEELDTFHGHMEEFGKICFRGGMERVFDALCDCQQAHGEAAPQPAQEALLAEAMDLLENWPLPKMGNPLREELAARRKALRVAVKALQQGQQKGEQG